MSTFLFALLDHAHQHLNTSSETRWAVTFVNNETRFGQITEIRNGTCLLRDEIGDAYYFDTRNVLYMKPVVAPNEH